MTEQTTSPSFFAARHYFVLIVLVALFSALLGRAAFLQVFNQKFLLGEGSQRQLRTIETAAYRGTILDRFGNPLAISTPVDSVWVNPKLVLQDLPGLKKVSKQLGLNFKKTVKKLKQRLNKEFVFIKRRVQPERAQQAVAAIKGAYLQREYNRFYPAGEVVAHVVGFTDIDNKGREGLELIYQDSLKARPGKRKILRNRKGEVVEEIARVVAAVPGQDLTTSIDMRLQYIAYRSLGQALRKYHAKSGSAILLDALNGEVLAIVSLPSYNPNKAKNNSADSRRNRAITDVFEPGSTIKPFTLAAAIDLGLFSPSSIVNTAPGYMKVTGYPVRDFRNYGKLDLAGILRKSSNVGAAKVALSMPSEDMWQAFKKYGFGEATGVSFPAASSGYLSFFGDWHPLDQATLAFGYGISVSVLQLARSYSIFANNGNLLPLSLLKTQQAPQGEQVMKPSTARQLLKMMEQVVGPKGTAKQAAIKGYRVAGKTGTVKKSTAGGYLENTYSAVFAGIAPASNPRLVMAVMVDEPDKEIGYYGGQVAAPVFREVMTQALRLMNISPDNPQQISTLAMSAHTKHLGKGEL
jgi:cell division protein FtsI (penicillin-binding protein 3)